MKRKPQKKHAKKQLSVHHGKAEPKAKKKVAAKKTAKNPNARRSKKFKEKAREVAEKAAFPMSGVSLEKAIKRKLAVSCVVLARKPGHPSGARLRE